MLQNAHFKTQKFQKKNLRHCRFHRPLPNGGPVEVAVQPEAQWSLNMPLCYTLIILVYTTCSLYHSSFMKGYYVRVITLRYVIYLLYYAGVFAVLLLLQMFGEALTNYKFCQHLMMQKCDCMTIYKHVTLYFVDQVMILCMLLFIYMLQCPCAQSIS